MLAVYCDMSLNDGVWTLVWKNSFMDNLPLSDNMRIYYNGYYKDCTSPGWCNIPDKASFSQRKQAANINAPSLDCTMYHQLQF